MWYGPDLFILLFRCKKEANDDQNPPKKVVANPNSGQSGASATKRNGDGETHTSTGANRTAIMMNGEIGNRVNNKDDGCEICDESDDDSDVDGGVCCCSIFGQD